MISHTPGQSHYSDKRVSLTVSDGLPLTITHDLFTPKTSVIRAADIPPCVLCSRSFSNTMQTSSRSTARRQVFEIIDIHLHRRVRLRLSHHIRFAELDVLQEAGDRCSTFRRVGSRTEVEGRDSREGTEMSRFERKAGGHLRGSRSSRKIRC